MMSGHDHGHGMGHHHGKGESPDKLDIEDHDTKFYSGKQLLLRAMHYIKPYMPQFVMIMIGMIINAFVKVYPVTL
jgi:hypothetical protein